MGPHGAAAVGHVQNVTVALLALIVAESGIGSLAGLFAIVLATHEVDGYILEAVIGLGEKELEGILRGGQMAIHAIHNDAGGVIRMGRCTPSPYRGFDLMARGAKFRCGSADHGIIGHAEDGKCNQNAQDDQRARCEKLFHSVFPRL